MHWWLEVHIGEMVEKCIVSIYLRPCKHSVAPPILVFREAMCNAKMGVWDARFLLQMKGLWNCFLEGGMKP